jgi:hypothetical protein
MNFKALFNRVINVIVKPVDEWQLIKGENSTKNEVIMQYALPLTLLVALASLLGGLLFTKSMLQLSFMHVLLSSVVAFIVTFVGMYISAFVVNELAPSFGTVKDLDKVFCLVVYSFIPMWVAGMITGLIPKLWILSLFGFYGIYVMWLGAPVITETPDDKKAGFVVVSVLIILGIYIVLSLILAAIISSLFITNVAVMH